MAGVTYTVDMADTGNMLTHAREAAPNYARIRAATEHSLGLAAGSTAQIMRQVEKGFSYTTFVRFHKESGLPVGTIAGLLRIPQRTLMRRKAKGRLRPDESERLLRVSGIFERALELFEGDANAARRWLVTPRGALDGQAPLDYARSEIGAREVEDLIGRLEDGVFT
jgi:putative toxin-antitoxin system antitoxin component (TIGR02293 family)